MYSDVYSSHICMNIPHIQCWIVNIGVSQSGEQMCDSFSSTFFFFFFEGLYF